MASYAELALRISADINQAESGLKNLQGKLNGISKDLTNMGKSMTMKVTAPIVAGFGLAVKGAADLEGAIAKFDVVFGEFAEEMHTWVGAYRNEFPLAEREIIKHAASLQDLLVPMGVARGEAMDMTQEWMHLAGALAAFNDVPIEQALEAIRSGIAGQSRPLRDLGINASVAAVEQTALAHGLIEAGEEMSDQVRQQALLIQAYEQSADAVGGLEEQKGSLLWIMQEVQATIKDVGDVIGNILLPHVKTGAEFIRDLLNRFKELDPGILEIIVKVALMAAAIGPILLGLGMFAKVLALAAGGLAFILSPAGLVIAAIGGLIAVLVHFWRTNEGFRDAVMNIWETVKSIFQTVVDAVGYLFKGDMHGFLVELHVLFIKIFGEGVANTLMDFVDFAIATFNNLKDFFANVMAAILAFWDKWGADIVSFATTTFTQVWGIIKQALEFIWAVIQVVLNRIQEFWDKWGGTIMSAWKFIWDVVMGVLSTAWEVIKGVVRGALNIISGIISVFTGILTGDWRKVWSGLGSIVKGAANVIIGLINGIINAAERMVNALASAVNRIPKFTIPSWVPGIGGRSFGLPTIPRISLPRIPLLKTGTNFVPQDMLAFLHKGEAVVPEKYNAAGGGITININGPISSEKDADYYANYMVKKLRLAGVNI